MTLTRRPRTQATSASPAERGGREHELRTLEQLNPSSTLRRGQRENKELTKRKTATEAIDNKAETGRGTSTATEPKEAETSEAVAAVDVAAGQSKEAPETKPRQREESEQPRNQEKLMQVSQYQQQVTAVGAAE